MMLIKQNVKELNNNDLVSEYGFISERIATEVSKRRNNMEEIRRMRDYQKELKEEIETRLESE